MRKTLTYRLFGWGKIPKSLRPTIEAEGIILADEGLPGSVTLRNFRAPGRRSLFRRNWFSGSVVLTEEHFLAFSTWKQLIGVPYGDRRTRELRCSVDDDRLFVAFEAGLFNDDWSGEVEYRFSTPRASEFLRVLQERIRRI